MEFSHYAEAAEPLSSFEYEEDVKPKVPFDRARAVDSIALGYDGTIFVSHPEDDVISVIDGDTFEVDTIPVGREPRGIAVQSFGDLVFVANYDSNTVSVIKRIQEEYRNIANVTSGGIHPYDVFIPESIVGLRSIVGSGNLTSSSLLNITGSDDPSNILYVINEEDEEEEGYPVSIVGEFSDGEWRNIKNISLDDIGDIDVSGDTAFVSGSNDDVSIIEDLEGEYKNVANVSVGFYPDIITASNPFVYVGGEGIFEEEASEGVSKEEEEEEEGEGIVSIIYRDRGEYKNIGNVTVSEDPTAVMSYDVDAFLSEKSDVDSEIMYVANADEVSAFKFFYGGDNHFNITNIANIDVGESAVDIATLPFTDTVFVADSGGVSMINTNSNKLQVGVSLEVEPSHAGYVNCIDQFQNNIKVPTNRYVYVDYQSPCTAKANEGFQFSSWTQQLGSNSSRTISSSQGDWLANVLNTFSGKPTPSILNVTRFGNFTANFIQSPPAIPPEYLATLFTVVVTAFVGSWVTPTVIGWRKTRSDGKQMNYFHQRIAKLEEDRRLDEKDIEPLGLIRREVLDAYSKGKMNENQCESLKNEISVLHEKIFRTIIDSIGSFSDKDTKRKQLDKIKSEIEYAYSEGRIAELHYELLNKRIAGYEDNRDRSLSR